MYFETHNDYIKQYEKGIKKISFRAYSPRISSSLDLEFKPYKSYDLHFAKDGKLTALFDIHYRGDKIQSVIKYNYAYSYCGKILTILATDLFTQVLDKQIQFYYDELGRIEKEEILHYSRYSDYDFLQEFYHTYENNYHRIVFDDQGLDDEIECIDEKWYDDKNNIIERKFWSSEAGIHYWEKYDLDNKGNIVKEYDVNDDGSITEKEPYPYKWDTIIEGTKEKGFIRETDLRDGEPVNIKETTIEYY